MLGVRSGLLCGTRHDQRLLNLTHTSCLLCPFRPESFQAFRSVPQTVMEEDHIQMAAKHSLGQPAMLIVNLKPLASCHSH